MTLDDLERSALKDARSQTRIARRRDKRFQQTGFATHALAVGQVLRVCAYPDPETHSRRDPERSRVDRWALHYHIARPTSATYISRDEAVALLAEGERHDQSQLRLVLPAGG